MMSPSIGGFLGHLASRKCIQSALLVTWCIVKREEACHHAMHLVLKNVNGFLSFDKQIIA
jgi:hypothetical protein